MEGDSEASWAVKGAKKTKSKHSASSFDQILVLAMLLLMAMFLHKGNCSEGKRYQMETAE